MYLHLLRHLLQQELIQPEDAEKIALFESKKPFSLHWELKTLLYLGVLLLNVGLGALVYQHIDSIGHAALIVGIGAVSAVCLGYALRRRQPFSRGEVPSPTPYYDYVLLLGCLTFLIMEGYAQYQYQVFGSRYGLATFVPMALFFGLAYWLDNRGVLSLAITMLASWLGVTVTPQDLLAKNDFNSEVIVNTGVFLGLLLAAVPFLSERQGLKKHFSLTYLNFGSHIGMVSCLAGTLALERPLVYLPLLCLFVGFFLWYARTRGSFYFLTVAVLYGYIGFSYLFLRIADEINLDIMIYTLYFLVSCVGVIFFFMNYKRFIKNDAP